MAMHTPVHPGDFIRTEIIAAHGLSVTAAATALGVSRPTLSNLLNRNADLSGEMALRLEKAFGVSMDTLMRMQGAYDIAQARKNAGKIRVRRYQPDSAHARLSNALPRASPDEDEVRSARMRCDSSTLPAAWRSKSGSGRRQRLEAEDVGALRSRQGCVVNAGRSGSVPASFN